MHALLELFRPFLRLAVVATACVMGAATSGCAAPQQYAWQHPESGEFLFEFDRSECVAQATTVNIEAKALSRVMGDRNGPFFQCMYNRGYSLAGTSQSLPLPASGRTASAK